MSTLTKKRILTKEEITEKALSYDSRKDLPNSIVFMKGVRYALSFIIPFVQDSYRSKIENLIK